MPNKIIDCFLFYDEVEMLNFRLSELDKYVDYFIIIETDKDLLGNNKSSYCILIKLYLFIVKFLKIYMEKMLSMNV